MVAMRILEESFWSFGLVALIMVMIAMALALWHAPWRAVLARQERQHLLFAFTLFYSLFWVLDIHAGEQLRFHLLGMTTAVLLFGWHLAIVIGTTAVILAGFWAGADITTLSVEALFTVVIPASLILGIYRLVSAIPNINLFAYTFGIGFLGTVFSILLLAAICWCYINLLGSEALITAFDQYGFILLLMAFPEGFINGAVVSMLAVFRPDLLRTLDEKRLIDDQ